MISKKKERKIKTFFVFFILNNIALMNLLSQEIIMDNVYFYNFNIDTYKRVKKLEYDYVKKHLKSKVEKKFFDFYIDKLEQHLIKDTSRNIVSKKILFNLGYMYPGWFNIKSKKLGSGYFVWFRLINCDDCFDYIFYLYLFKDTLIWGKYCCKFDYEDNFIENVLETLKTNNEVLKYLKIRSNDVVEIYENLYNLFEIQTRNLWGLHRQNKRTSIIQRPEK
jgi:hypothetical protein